MSRPDPRFVRQSRLAEVGEVGQARIVAYTAELARGAVGDVAALYLERAGAQTRFLDAEAPVASVPDVLPHDPEARAFAEGACVALHHVRVALGMA